MLTKTLFKTGLHLFIALLFLHIISYNGIVAQNSNLITSENGVITLTTSNFDTLINTKGVALVDFWATWCGPCLMQAPIIEEVKKEIGEGALVGKLDVDRNSAISRRYSIRGIPALLIFKDGVLVERLVGFQQKHKLLASLQKHIAD